MQITEKALPLSILGRDITLFNQHSPDWREPYACPAEPDDTLHTAGCGIFSLCHAVQWITGRAADPAKLAAFSVSHGARGDDGTDRPALLAALMAQGHGAALGIACAAPLQNDLGRLYHHLSQPRHAALCNLRAGHIVCLIAARAKEGELQALALDSHPVTVNARQFDAVREIYPSSSITYPTINVFGVQTGYATQAAAFWTRLSIARDYNLIFPLDKI